MEINISNDIKYYINSSRIRSLRRRKRAQRDAYDKELLKLYREYDAIRKDIHSLGWEDLKPPIQNGWMRSFVLRDDVKRTRQGIFYQQILDKINTTEYSWRKDFKKKRRQHGRKVYVVREQALRRPDEKEFFSKKFTDEERACFHEALTHPPCSKTPVKVYTFTEAWRYVLKTSPRMITKVRILDVDLKRKESELSNYIDRHNLWPKILKLLAGFSYDYHSGHRYPSPFKNKSFHNILAEHWPITEITSNPRIDPGGFFFCSHVYPDTFTNFEIRSIHHARHLPNLERLENIYIHLRSRLNGSFPFYYFLHLYDRRYQLVCSTVAGHRCIDNDLYVCLRSYRYHTKQFHHR